MLRPGVTLFTLAELKRLAFHRAGMPDDLKDFAELLGGEGVRVLGVHSFGMFVDAMPARVYDALQRCPRVVLEDS